MEAADSSVASPEAGDDTSTASRDGVLRYRSSVAAGGTGRPRERSRRFPLPPQTRLTIDRAQCTGRNRATVLTRYGRVTGPRRVCEVLMAAGSAHVPPSLCLQEPDHLTHSHPVKPAAAAVPVGCAQLCLLFHRGGRWRLRRDWRALSGSHSDPPSSWTVRRTSSTSPPVNT